MEEQSANKKNILSLSPEKVTIGAIVSFLFLVFGAIVVFSAQYGGNANTTSSTSATPAPEGLFQAGAQSNLSAKKQVAGAQTKQSQVGVEQPAVQATPAPTSSPSPSPTPTPSPSPSASPTPTPSPTPSPSTSSGSSDSEGPKITGVSSDSVESTKATIKFTVNEDADAKIEYGESTSYGKTKEESSKKTAHTVELADLEPNKNYHYRIISKDNAGNSTTSGNNEFTTKP
mgnify:CR=1 FL=1